MNKMENKDKLVESILIRLRKSELKKLKDFVEQDPEIETVSHCVRVAIMKFIRERKPVEQTIKAHSDRTVVEPVKEVSEK